MTALAADTIEDFSRGAIGWYVIPTNSDICWKIIETLPGVYAYCADVHGDTTSKQTNFTLGASWQLAADVHFQDYYSPTSDEKKRATASFGLFPEGKGIRFLADIDQITDGSIRLDIAWFEPTNMIWHKVSDSGWLSGSAPVCHMHLIRPRGSDRITFTVSSTNGFFYQVVSLPIPLGVLDGLDNYGFRVNNAKVDFSNVTISTPSIASPPSLAIEVKTVRVNMAVTGGLRYQLESSNDLLVWIDHGSPFTATDATVLLDIDIIDGQRYFQVIEVP